MVGKPVTAESHVQADRRKMFVAVCLNRPGNGIKIQTNAPFWL